MRVPSEKEIEAGAEALVQWMNPPHSGRVAGESDRQAAKAVLMAARRKRMEHDDPRLGIPTKSDSQIAVFFVLFVLCMGFFTLGIYVGSLL